MNNDLKDFTEKIREHGKKQKRFRTCFDDFPRYVIAGERSKPNQTVLKVYLSKSKMVSVHRETNGNGFVFVNYLTRATVLKNLAAYGTTISENDWFAALAEKIFYYLTRTDEMKEILQNRKKQLGGGGLPLMLGK